MTYHLERTMSLPTNLKLDLDFDRKVRFPEKLREALEDPSPMLHWSDDGKSLIADEKRFEEAVLKRYPGLVQIASFLNFRRQLREYGFDWTANEDGTYGFYHPSFSRDRIDMMQGVLTKRKSFGGHISMSSTAVDGRCRGRPSYKRCRTRTFYRNSGHNSSILPRRCGPGRPVKIRRFSEGAAPSCHTPDCNAVKVLKITVDNTTPLNDCPSHDKWSYCSSPLSNERIDRRHQLHSDAPQPAVSRLSSYAHHTSSYTRQVTESDPHEWWTYCAPWGPIDELQETVSTQQNETRIPNCAATKSDIPILFYDDNGSIDATQVIDKTELEFGLEGRPKITPADEQLDHWQYKEIRYYYAL